MLFYIHSAVECDSRCVYQTGWVLEMRRCLQRLQSVGYTNLVILRPEHLVTLDDDYWTHVTKLHTKSDLMISALRAWEKISDRKA